MNRKYDDNEYNLAVSEIYCTGLWNFKFIFDCYYNTKKDIIK